LVDKDTLIKSGLLLSSVSALIFLCGWRYAHTFYQIYGINFSLLEIELSNYYVFGVLALVNSWYSAIILLFCILLFLFYCRLPDVLKKLSAIIIPIIFVMLVLYVGNTEAYNNHAKNMCDCMMNYPNAEIYTDLQDEDLKKELEIGEYKIFHQGKYDFFLIKPSYKSPSLAGLFAINREDIDYIQFKAAHKSCEKTLDGEKLKECKKFISDTFH